MRILKKYKNEISLLIILILFLVCFWKNSLVDVQDILSYGTFVIGFLSIPSVASRFMPEKEKSNRIYAKQNDLEADKFYYETLNILNDLSDSSSIKIKIIQLSKIRNQGYKYLSEDSAWDFNKILSDTAVNILSQDVNFIESDDHRIIVEIDDENDNETGISVTENF